MPVSYKKLMRSIENAALVGGWWYDIETNKMAWTDAVRIIREVDDNYIPSFADTIKFYNSPFDELIEKALQTTISDGKPFKIKASITTAKGNLKWINAFGAANYQNKKITAVYGAIQDITDEVNKSEELLKTVSATQVTLDSLVEGLIVIDLDGIITSFNKAAEKIFKYSRDEIVGKPIETLMPEPYRSHHHGYMKTYQKTKVPKVVGIGREVTGLKSDGTTFPFHLSINHIDGPLGLGYVGTVRDLSEEKHIAERLEWLSHYDDLTGLPNRVTLINYLNKAENQKALSLVAINLHDFRKVNLAYDFSEGDLVLKAVAQRLKDFAGSHHFAARDIADRFWLVIDHAYVQNLESIVNELMSTLRNVICGGLVEHHFSISLGVASAQHNNMLNNLVTRAETALFSAKQNGVNQVCYFEAIFAEEVLSEYQVEKSLRKALENEALECWLQPKVDSHYKVVSAEVLVRWKDRYNNYIPPDKFIGIAEKTGLILPLGSFVANKTAQMLAHINRIDPDFRLAMNVSPLQFLQSNFLFDLINCFDKYNANLSNLTIEVTETLLVNDTTALMDLLNELGKYAIQVSIDDFGTGYSNLKRIIDMPISELKIDKQFVQNCLTDKKSERLLSAIVGLSKVMDYHIVAEGVESIDIANHCIDLGIDFLQGYCFGKPEPFNAFLKTANLIESNHPNKIVDFVSEC